MDRIKKVQRMARNIKYRITNKNKDFTIISQDCLGAEIYAQLGLQFASPTINMFIEDANFVKLVHNFEHYLISEPFPITDTYVDPISPSIRYPKIGIDDIELCCLHYKNCEEAIEAWNRRKQRVNLDNCYVLGNSWNMHNNIDLIKELSVNHFKKTIIFTVEDMQIDNCLKLPGDIWSLNSRGIVKPTLIDIIPGSYLKYYETFFNFVEFLN